MDSPPVEKLYRPPGPFTIHDEIADLIERTALFVGNTKKLAPLMKVEYVTVRSWIKDGKRFPLWRLPDLIHAANPTDPFLPRLAAHMGFRLSPLHPSPEQVVAALEEANVLKHGQAKTARRVVRGLRRDDRQALLGFSE